MVRAMVSPGADQGASEVDALHQLALRYLDEFPWADVAALEANMSILGTATALRQALAHFLQPMGFGLGAPRFLVVRALYLADERRLSLGAIARAINVTSTNVTSLIDGLEREGWVRRSANPRDRRMTFAQLTPEGEERCTRLIPAVAEFTGLLFRDFSNEDKLSLVHLLARLRQSADSALPDHGSPLPG